ncbi:DUF6381 family protein [Streptomyces sp. TR06-5]|uniref:DUF6381 family protein n=1 Tax=unclassified Streptomyces TaxID=2593676 RepID=UPI0039A2166D
MTAQEESRRRVQQMRAQLRDLSEAAERTQDPEQRERLREKARRMESRCEQESGMAGGDIYPPL